jgi:hypothetical protein
LRVIVDSVKKNEQCRSVALNQELYRRMDALAREYLRTDEKKSERRAEILKSCPSSPP